MDRLLQVEKALKANDFEVSVFQNKEEAKIALLEDIKPNQSLAIGGSMTCQEMGIYEELRARGHQVYWHWRKDVESPLVKAREAHSYITSSNAVTKDGKLVNMDGNGNRVASMIYGHEKVYVLIGRNKITENYQEARERIQNIAAPLNAKRLNLNTPCVHTGKCTDCDSIDRICKAEVIIHKNPSTSKIHIYLINEDLGY